MVLQARRGSGASHFSSESVISAITMESEDRSGHSRFSISGRRRLSISSRSGSGHSRRSLRKVYLALRSLAERRGSRSSNPDEEEPVRQGADLQLKPPRRNYNRFSTSSSEGDMGLCAMPRRRLSGELHPEDDKCHDDGSIVSEVSPTSQPTSHYSVEWEEEDVDSDVEFELPIQQVEERPKHQGRPRRKYYRKRSKIGSNSSVSSWSSISFDGKITTGEIHDDDDYKPPRRKYRRKKTSASTVSSASSISSDEKSHDDYRPRWVSSAWSARSRHTR